METNPTTVQEDKTVAVLSYCTLIGFIIALVMHSSNPVKTKLGAYHLRQALGLFIAGVVFAFTFMIIAFIPFVNMILIVLAPAVWIFVFVCLILGIVNAANAQHKPLPLIGPLFEKWFAGAFN